MTLLGDWLGRYVTPENTAALFAETDLVVDTFLHGAMRKLRRSQAFDALMVRTVEEGLLTGNWEGIVYVMHWRRGDEIAPLYVGKAERRGVTQALNYNLANIRKNQHAFGRWGYGLAYHIGDLSHALFGEAAYKKSNRKYAAWAGLLFAQLEPPTLKEQVYVGIISWHGA